MGGKYAQRLCTHSKPKTSTPPTSHTRTRENSDRSTWNSSRGKDWEPQSKNIMKKEAGRCEKEPNHGFWKRTYSHWKQTKKQAAYWMTETRENWQTSRWNGRLPRTQLNWRVGTQERTVKGQDAQTGRQHVPCLSTRGEDKEHGWRRRRQRLLRTVEHHNLSHRGRAPVPSRINIHTLDI